ncbi:MAG: hypothetical protein U1A77_03745 [Pirellulales bacterium]
MYHTCLDQRRLAKRPAGSRGVTLTIAFLLAFLASGPEAFLPSSAAGERQFESLFEIPYSGEGMPMTMLPDAGNRPVLYVAAKEGGLRIYRVSGSPKLVRTLATGEWQSMHVMSLAQVGKLLYLALGNHWSKHESAGLAVIDVQDPATPKVLGFWKDSQVGGAGGAVVVQDTVAYLAAMGAGVIALDVRIPAQIRVLGRLQPEMAFPDVRPDKAKINARGLAIQKNRLWLCYDAGGVRVIDIADPRKLTEVGRYSSPELNGRPRAYNQIVLHGSLAYVAADYMGMEILDISNPRSIKRVGWWNPWNPGLQPFKWFSSPGHGNELAYDVRSKTVLMAAGRSDLVAIDVTDPTQPRQVGGVGQIEDTQATWGLALEGDRVYLSYILALGIPFRADWRGVKAFRYRR